MSTIPTTDVGIVNLALIELGEPPIASMSEGSKAAKVATAIYEPVVQEVLRDHPWRCAQKRAHLSADPDFDTETIEYTHACKLPPDYIRAILVNDNLTHFERAGKHILVDDEAPWMIYIARIPESEFDPSLVSVISATLAARMCMSLTDNATLKDAMEKVLVPTRVANAKLTDAMDGVAREPAPGELERARL